MPKWPNQWLWLQTKIINKIKSLYRDHHELEKSNVPWKKYDPYKIWQLEITEKSIYVGLTAVLEGDMCKKVFEFCSSDWFEEEDMKRALDYLD